MGRRELHRARIQYPRLRDRLGRTYAEIAATGVTSFTHLPWELSNERDPATWVWCALGCERAYQLRDAMWVPDLPGEFPPEINASSDGAWYCAYFPDCDKDAVFDAWVWNELLRRGWRGPAVPLRGARYPLYRR